MNEMYGERQLLEKDWANSEVPSSKMQIKSKGVGWRVQGYQQVAIWEATEEQNPPCITIVD